MAKTLIQIAIDERKKQLTRKQTSETNQIIKDAIQSEIDQLEKEYQAFLNVGKK